MEQANQSCFYLMSFLAILAIRALYVLYLTGKPRRNKSTAALYSHRVRFRFTPRFYMAAATDNMSLQKARVFEDSLVDKVPY
ncbi:hypothetical protein LWI29_007482 [Acer saccharum]|uniref:Uncharacterized protein n=1 Tax=Acer saccharum TaxID=4024 RepID=A0AA39RH27_ACESA|nr:hypothetical protein LWI29_007482 [Acer saccharum]